MRPMTVILDDDPTGTQSMADVPVILDWAGSISDVPLERAIDKVAGGLGYSVEEHEVVLTGACADWA